jgi:outer membrane protein assembly factor BamB
MTSRRPLALAALSVLALSTSALASVWSSSSADMPASQSSDRLTAENRARLEAVAAKVEGEFIIGPAAAGDLGYRIVWQASLPLIRGAAFKHTHLAGEAIFAIDAANNVARLRPSDGQQIWRVGVGSPVDIFRGIDWIETPIVTGSGPTRMSSVEPRVYISTDTECFVLDGATGSIAKRQDFNKLPTTKPLNIGKFLIYGTLGGQIVWHHAIVGQEWRANSLDSTVRGSLAHAKGMVIAASDRGMVLALDQNDASRRWARQTFGGVLAAPAASDTTVFIAALDQYLWAFDLRTGETRWKYFTQSPLKTPPFPVADVVLQFVPGEGLVCFNADSTKIDGEVRWRNASAAGVPIGMITTGSGDRIVLWEQSSRTMTLVDPNLGSSDSTFHFPKAAELELVRSGPFAGDFFATSEDGHILRLTPRFARAAELIDEKPMTPAEPPLSIPLEASGN